ncbi:MAG: ROK family protein [Saprospiraceae bacterium]
MKKLAVGIDIGGTNTVFGLVDNEGYCFAESSVKTGAYPDINEYVNVVSNGIRELLQSLKDCELIGIGIGAPNGNYYKGTIEFAPNLKWKGIVPLAELFHEELNLPVILTNDANAAAYGEMVYGNAKGMKDFMVVTLGTGVGSGLVVNGEMVYGHDGFAGEVGHTTVFPGGRMCGCGRKGCLEAYCSAGGIVDTYFEILDSKGIEHGEKNEDINPKTIYDLAKSGDESALETYNKTGEILGMALTNSVAHLSPEAIFLFGGITNSGPMIFDPIYKSFEENLLPIYKNKIKIAPSGVKANEAAILGAASLIWKQELKS